MNSILEDLWLKFNGPKIIRAKYANQKCNVKINTGKELRRSKTLFGEKPLVEWLFVSIDPSNCFWDIGAYHGHYSIVAATKNINVYSFEPLQANQVRLIDNIIINGFTNIKVIPVALSDENGTSKIGSNVNSKAKLGVKNGDFTFILKGDNINFIEEPTHIKIDVEGYELRVLEGLNNTLRSVEKMVIEIHNQNDYKKVKNMLTDLGFDTFTKDIGRSEIHLCAKRNN